MIQKSGKPDQRGNADRADVSKAHNPKIVEGSVLRNDQHRSLSREPHVWRKALMATDLPASSFRVALAIVDIFVNRKNGACFPSLETIAATCGLSVSGAKKGVSALREAGLIYTEKRRFNGSNTILLCLPPSDRKDLNGSVRTAVEKTETGPSIVPIQVPRKNPNGSHISTHPGPLTFEDNRSTEPLKQTSEDRVIPCGPPSAVGADAPPFDQDLTRPANVEGNRQPLDPHGEKGEAVIRSQDLAEQRRIVERISGEKGHGPDHVNQALLQMMRDGKLTESSGAALVAEYKQRGAENAA
ncbi:helix-turn-helix domain-containing protein [Agrobacterium tumefaciens]|uniref:Helix-turn-helix domain-containing protein n=1 Tax=Agrobacterium tumefaciens TaxID=358 RepID=A0AA44F7S7_AGRTU|nr:helix-turn-helix domain-containing protein [Agrobacterium tumefaciens]NTB86398.1 helix-turn-helix domain-containing protein [Agrobacterium tumefaciens]NTC17414.1 helix-turn-helix domain-containing protein [Agrobacterium tumefaciens]NTC30275.1 helix-turn-helix domain-containing protein [Agrobacterium tumefaciens]